MTSGSDQNSVVNVGADGKLVAAQAPSATPLKYNPKIGIGCCYCVGLRWAVAVRKAGRRESRDALRDARSGETLT